MCIKRKIIKAALFLLVILMVFNIAGCTKKETKLDSSQGNITSQNQQNTLKEPVKITYMLPLDPGCEYTSETWSITEWGKRTGVKFEIQGIARDTFTEKFAAVMASGNLPDMINFYRDAITYKQYGPQLFVALDDYMQKGLLPNLMKKIEKYPDIREVMDHPEDGKMYGFPLVQDFEYFSNCWYVRNDILNKAGYDADDITTLEKFKEAMLALKNSMGKDYITSSRLGFSYFAGVTLPYFGTSTGILYDNRNPNGSNKYVYGPLQPGFKIWVETMNWMYKNKLLHPNFATMQQQELFAGYVDGTFPLMMEQFTMGLYTFNTDAKNIKAIIPFQVNGVRYRVPKHRNINIGFRFPVVISKNSKVIEDAMRAMDYVYGEEGNIIMSRGLEGVHWVKDDAYPAGFKIIGFQTPYLQKELGEEKFKALPRPIEDLGINSWWLMGSIPAWNRYNLWKLGADEKEAALSDLKLLDKFKSMNLLIPADPVIEYTKSEQELIAEISTPLNTYVEENSMKFITGQRPLSEWEDFIKGLEKFNYTKLVELANTKLQQKKK